MFRVNTFTLAVEALQRRGLQSAADEARAQWEKGERWIPDEVSVSQMDPETNGIVSGANWVITNRKHNTQRV